MGRVSALVRPVSLSKRLPLRSSVVELSVAELVDLPAKWKAMGEAMREMSRVTTACLLGPAACQSCAFDARLDRFEFR